MRVLRTIIDPAFKKLLVRPVFRAEPSECKVAPQRLRLQFNGAAWNAHKSVLRGTNCYAYALNCPEAGWAVPGALTAPQGKVPTKIARLSVRAMHKRVMADGLIPITEDEALSGETHAIAMVVAPGLDFHFLRRDVDGTWSDKGGQFEAVQNPTIIRPSKDGLRDEYTKFAGYYAIPQNGVQYCPRMRIPEPLLQIFG